MFSMIVFLQVRGRQEATFTLFSILLFFLRAALDVTMAADDEDELLRSMHAQDISVGFAAGSERVNVYRQEEGSELSQSVCA